MQPTLADLEDIYKQIAIDHFKGTFQYEFNDQSTVPPSLAPGTSVLSSFERFYKIEDENRPAIRPGSSTSGTENDGTTEPFESIPDDRQRKAPLCLSSVYIHSDSALSEILNDFKNRVSSLPDWMQG
jgi:hypothetical protein